MGKEDTGPLDLKSAPAAAVGQCEPALVVLHKPGMDTGQLAGLTFLEQWCPPALPGSKSGSGHAQGGCPGVSIARQLPGTQKGPQPALESHRCDAARGRGTLSAPKVPPALSILSLSILSACQAPPPLCWKSGAGEECVFHSGSQALLLTAKSAPVFPKALIVPAAQFRGPQKGLSCAFVSSKRSERHTVSCPLSAQRCSPAPNLLARLSALAPAASAGEELGICTPAAAGWVRGWGWGWLHSQHQPSARRHRHQTHH